MVSPVINCLVHHRSIRPFKPEPIESVLGHYTEAFLTGESRGNRDNLRKARFTLTEG